MRKTVLFILLCALCTFVLGGSRLVPGPAEELIVQYNSVGAVYTAGRCAGTWAPTGSVACDDVLTISTVTDDWTVTRYSTTVSFLGWELLEGCDLVFQDDGVAAFTHQIGATGFAAVGEHESVDTLFEIAAASKIQLLTNDPVHPADTNCITGDNCVCNGAVGGFVTSIWGIKH